MKDSDRGGEDRTEGAIADGGGAGWSAAPAAPRIEQCIEEAERTRSEPVAMRPLRIVCIGGGTGLPVVLRGLARRGVLHPEYSSPSITAIVAMSDDGGSSGRLRRSRRSLPPGDVRKCLVALARSNSELSKVFQYRFSDRPGLAGHAVGNLLITAMAELKGDFLGAVQASALLLGVRGKVLPCTLSPVELVTHKAGDVCVVGERNLARVPGRVLRVNLRPKAPPAVEGALEAISSADLISIGPGSLYSSILPNLLVDGIAAALKRTRALKVLICNLMTQPGETDGMDCADHVRALVDHIGPLVDVALINDTPPPLQAVQAYARRGSMPVLFNRASVVNTGVIPVEADVLRDGLRIRHDGRKLARRLIRLGRCGP
jgi:uncharacterized cofD-like protein